MTEPRREVISWVRQELGTTRMAKLTLLSAIGLVLVLALVGMLAGVFLSGSATIDDLGVPLAFLVILAPIAAGGVIHGALGLRGLRRHPLLLALEGRAALTRCEIVSDGGWNGVRFVVQSGESYTLWAARRDWAPFVVATLTARA